MTDFTAISRLFGISEPCGYPESDLAYWVNAYGAIPRVLQDYYTQLGRHELNSAQDFLVSPAQFEEYSEPDYMVFYSENQDGILWAVHRDDVRQENPPVYENYDGENWHISKSNVREFLISMAHLQGVMCLEYSNEEYLDISPAQSEEIADRFPTKNADSDLYTGVKFYGNYDDTVIVVMNNHEAFILMYSSATEEHFDEVDRIIGDILAEE